MRKNPPLPPKAELRLLTGQLRDYRYMHIRHEPIKDVRAEYRRLYRIYQNRTKRLAADPRFSDFAAEQSGRFLPVSKLTDREVQRTLIDVARWVLNREYFSLTGQTELRRRRIEALQAADIPVTEENFDDFGEFMRVYRDTKLDEIFDSDAAVEVYDIAINADLDLETIKADMETWLKNRKSAKRLSKRVRDDNRQKFTSDSDKTEWISTKISLTPIKGG